MLCDLEVMDSSHGNNLLQYKIKLRTIDLIWYDPFLGFCIGGNFVHWATFYKSPSLHIKQTIKM